MSGSGVMLGRQKGYLILLTWPDNPNIGLVIRMIITDCRPLEAGQMTLGSRTNHNLGSRTNDSSNHITLTQSNYLGSNYIICPDLERPG